MDTVIAPSILSANFARLGEEVTAVLEAGADMIHFDVMDNHFVPNLTVGPMVCAALRSYGITAPIDVHLMVQPVNDLIKNFADAGATYISFHPEASDDVAASLKLIRELHCKATLAINPETSLDHVEQHLDLLDMVLIMSVNPGFAGQTFIPATLDKLRTVHKMIGERDIRLEIDGGVKINNVKEIAATGADTFVAGSAIFNSNDYQKTITMFRKHITAVR